MTLDYEHSAVVYAQHRDADGSQTYGARAEFSSAMRRADSILTAMSDAEIDGGIAALRERQDEIERFELSCLILREV